MALITPAEIVSRTNGVGLVYIIVDPNSGQLECCRTIKAFLQALDANGVNRGISVDCGMPRSTFFGEYPVYYDYTPETSMTNEKLAAIERHQLEFQWQDILFNLLLVQPQLLLTDLWKMVAAYAGGGSRMYCIDALALQPLKHDYLRSSPLVVNAKAMNCFTVMVDEAKSRMFSDGDGDNPIQPLLDAYADKSFDYLIFHSGTSLYLYLVYSKATRLIYRLDLSGFQDSLTQRFNEADHYGRLARRIDPKSWKERVPEEFLVLMNLPMQS